MRARNHEGMMKVVYGLLLLWVCILSASATQIFGNVSCATNDANYFRDDCTLSTGVTNGHVSAFLFPWRSIPSLSLRTRRQLSDPMPADLYLGLERVVNKTTETLDLSVSFWRSSLSLSDAILNTTIQRFDLMLIGHIPDITCAHFAFDNNTDFYKCSLRQVLTYLAPLPQQCYANNTLFASIHPSILSNKTFNARRLAISSSSEGWWHWLSVSRFNDTTGPIVNRIPCAYAPLNQRLYIYPLPSNQTFLDSLPRAQSLCNPSRPPSIISINPFGTGDVITTTTPTTNQWSGRGNDHFFLLSIILGIIAVISIGTALIIVFLRCVAGDQLAYSSTELELQQLNVKVTSFDPPTEADYVE